MKSVFIMLQTIATVCLAVATEQFAVKEYWLALIATVVGVGVYVVYELLPPKD